MEKDMNWAPLSIKEVTELFHHAPFMWMIAGGWALDLHIGFESREHGDMDIVFKSSDQEKVFHFLSKDWELYKAKDGGLAPWQAGEFSVSIDNIWARKNTQSPWAFQMLFVEDINEQWLYKREKSITKPIEDLLLRSVEGIPYMRPEVQLLYKAGSSNIRKKDLEDFLLIWPSLNETGKHWFNEALTKQFPAGHEWLEKEMQEMKKSNVGYTIFKATGVRHEYLSIDLDKQQVTAAVLYKEKIHMTVIIDLKEETVQTDGDVAELEDLSMDKEDYINMFEQQAKFFIENNISDPRKYYEALINSQL